MAAQKKAVWAWALYDAGNSAFATVVMAGFFPVLFKSYWSALSDATVSTARLAMANAGSGLLIALLAPLLGAIADGGRSKKRFLGFFATAGMLATAALAAVPKGQWQTAAALYCLGAAGFAGANIFYDALLPSVADRKSVDYVSALGYALGYLGGGVLFAVCTWMALRPAVFGLAQDARETAVMLCFPLTAVWWAAFSVPLMAAVREPALQTAVGLLQAVRNGVQQLRATAGDLRRQRPAWIFLLAYWCYIDGVFTIMRMAVDYGLSLGFAASDLIVALLVTQFVGFPCALAFGKLGQRRGTRRALYAGIAGYLVIVVWGMAMRSKTEFYVLAVLVGIVQGGVQSLSRSFFARLIPRENAAQFFGFYNMVGKCSAILGPALMGATGYLLRSPRAGIAALSLFFVLGAALLSVVREPSGQPGSTATF